MTAEADLGISRRGGWLLALTAGLTLVGCGAAGQTSGANGTSSSPTPAVVAPSASPTPPAAVPTASPTPSGDVTIGQLTVSAKLAAASSGDPGVHVADAVLTTREPANTLTSGDIVYSNEAVYLVQLLGHFTWPADASPGEPATGISLTLIIDVAGGRETDTGLMHKAADLSSLGPVIVLHW